MAAARGHLIGGAKPQCFPKQVTLGQTGWWPRSVAKFLVSKYFCAMNFNKRTINRSPYTHTPK